MSISFPEGFHEAPSPAIPETKESFFKMLDENVVYLNDEEYRKTTEKVFGQVPLSGVCLNVSIIRNSEHTPLGFAEPSIFVNRDYYQRGFGEDFIDMIPYDLEHEKWEIYYATKQGLNPDALDLNKGDFQRHFGTSHRLATRMALRKADSEGKLDRYIEWTRKQSQSFEDMGIKGPMQEFELRKTEATKIRKR